jgi:ribonuclease P protein component
MSAQNPHILKKRPSFLAVAATGKKWVAPGLILQFGTVRSDEETIAVARYGLTASKRVGNAVCRNRAKRRLRALVQEILIPHAKPNRDYVLVARTTTLTRKYSDLRDDLIMALKRMKAWREGSA